MLELFGIFLLFAVAWQLAPFFFMAVIGVVGLIGAAVGAVFNAVFRRG